MDLAIHSGFRQTEPNVTITEDPPIYGDCKVTRYRFTDSDGAVLIITHFEHAHRPQVQTPGSLHTLDPLVPPSPPPEPLSQVLPRSPQVDSDNPEPQPTDAPPSVEMF